MELDDIARLIELFDRSSLTELRYRKADEQVLIRRSPAEPGAVPGPAPSARLGSADPDAAIGGEGASGGASGGASSGAHTQPAPDAGTRGQGRADTEIIASPMVGTFYRSPSLDAEPFVREGQRVEKGHTLCILEAMKLMNQIEAEFPCEILRIFPANAVLVEYGTPLFEVRRA